MRRLRTKSVVPYIGLAVIAAFAALIAIGQRL